MPATVSNIASNSGTSTSTLSVSVDTTAYGNPNRLLIVAIIGVDQSIASVSFNGNAMTAYGSTSTTGGNAQFFYLADVTATSSTVDVVLDGVSEFIGIAAAVFYDVDIGSPLGNFTSNSLESSFLSCDEPDPVNAYDGNFALITSVSSDTTSPTLSIDSSDGQNNVMGSTPYFIFDYAESEVNWYCACAVVAREALYDNNYTINADRTCSPISIFVVTIKGMPPAAQTRTQAVIVG